MRYPLIALKTALAVLLGSFITSALQPPAELTIRGQAWCLVATYPSMKAYDQEKPLQSTLIDVHSKGVTVYTEC